MRKRVWRVLALCGILAAALCVTAWADKVGALSGGGGKSLLQHGNRENIWV